MRKMHHFVSNPQFEIAGSHDYCVVIFYYYYYLKKNALLG